jgi:hypothetical protein
VYGEQILVCAANIFISEMAELGSSPLQGQNGNSPPTGPSTFTSTGRVAAQAARRHAPTVQPNEDVIAAHRNLGSAIILRPNAQNFVPSNQQLAELSANSVPDDGATPKASAQPVVQEANLIVNPAESRNFSSDSNALTRYVRVDGEDADRFLNHVVSDDTYVCDCFSSC